ncbi:MAG TPA: hypothetical protein VIM16_11480 [Mucilaginibacter sp.]|jgi:hypothetical protein
MKKIIIPGLIAGIILLVLGVFCLYLTIWLFPKLAIQYYNPAFNSGSGRNIIYYIHPFIIGMALSWFWGRIKGTLTGSFISRGIGFGLIYALIATFPMILLIYGAMSVSLTMVGTWFAFGLLQGVIAGLVFGKVDP